MSLIKKIYSQIPFKKQLFSLLRSLWSPPENLYKHLHFKGIINVPIDSSNAFKIKHHGYQVENEIFWSGLTGGWEKTSLKLWIELCRQSDTILDIGANTGVYALIAKTLKHNARVFAFEPVSRVFEKLRENNELNGYDIQCHQLAVSNYDGEGIFYDDTNEHTYSVTINKKVHDSRSIETKVATITLDTFIEKNEIRKIDLIKIDVESHEAEVLEGFSKHIKQFMPVILIEVLFEEVATSVRHIIKDLDYLYFHINENGTITQQGHLMPSHLNYNFLLCTKEIAKKLKLIG